jgi:CRP/FNR family transcriptional regulator
VFFFLIPYAETVKEFFFCLIFSNFKISHHQQNHLNVLKMNTKALFPDLNQKLATEIFEKSNIVDIPENIEVIHEGQYVKAVPIVTKGLIKVFTRNEDKELLLYYIQPGESCIMSFDACLKNIPSKVYASTETDSSVLLMPTDQVFRWMKEYPEFNSLFFLQYNQRYNELLGMINQLLFEKMDKRILDYLKAKQKLTGVNPVKISHRQIANDLGTAREVVSRVMKKLEHEGKVKQLATEIKII